MNNEIRIILADDHEVVRAGLKRLFSIDKDIIILGEARNGLEALDLVEYHKPDVALIDILMPKLNGIETTLEIKKNFSQVFVVMLTAFEDSLHIEKALAAGADGYLSKDISAKDLISSTRKVLNGERVFSNSILSIIQNGTYPFNSDDNKSKEMSITKREQEIINLVSNGFTSPQIAEQLFISVRTVQTHRANIMKKLNVKNTAGLVRFSLNKNDIH